MNSNERDKLPIIGQPHRRVNNQAFHYLMIEQGWGLDPWKRLGLLLPLVIPALLLVRVGLVLYWSKHDTWLVATSLDFRDWLQVAMGSFYSLLPGSAYLLALSLAFVLPALVRTVRAGFQLKKMYGVDPALETITDAARMFILFGPWVIEIIIMYAFIINGNYTGIAIAATTLIFGIVVGWLQSSTTDGGMTVGDYATTARYPHVPVISSPVSIEHLVDSAGQFRPEYPICS